MRLQTLVFLLKIVIVITMRVNRGNQSHCRKSIVFFNSYRPQTKLRKGNVFTLVCHSVHRKDVCGGEDERGRGGLHGRGHAWQGAYMAGGMCGMGACKAGWVWHEGASMVGETATAADGTYVAWLLKEFRRTVKLCRRTAQLCSYGFLLQRDLCFFDCAGSGYYFPHQFIGCHLTRLKHGYGTLGI